MLRPLNSAETTPCSLQWSGSAGLIPTALAEQRTKCLGSTTGGKDDAGTSTSHPAAAAPDPAQGAQVTRATVLTAHLLTAWRPIPRARSAASSPGAGMRQTTRSIAPIAFCLPGRANIIRREGCRHPAPLCLLVPWRARCVPCWRASARSGSCGRLRSATPISGPSRLPPGTGVPQRRRSLRYSCRRAACRSARALSDAPDRTAQP